MPSVCGARRNILPDRTNFLVPPPFGAWGSFSMPAKIAINGYGTIGKRVADAVALQDDMRLVGVAKTKPDFEAKLAVRKGHAVYAANTDALAKFEKAGVKAAGSSTISSARRTSSSTVLPRKVATKPST